MPVFSEASANTAALGRKAANYLYTIASHVCQDYYKQLKEIPFAALPDTKEQHTASPEQEITAKLALSSLPPELRETAIQASKTAFYESEANAPLSRLEFVYQQSRYIRKHWWILQAYTLPPSSSIPESSCFILAQTDGTAPYRAAGFPGNPFTISQICKNISSSPWAAMWDACSYPFSACSHPQKQNPPTESQSPSPRFPAVTKRFEASPLP